MIASIAVLVALSACSGAVDSGFSGDYETVDVSKQVGGCGGAGDPQVVGGDVHWFRLADVDDPAGRLVGYFPCQDLGVCADQYNLYLSFGSTGGAWITTVSTAIDPGCTLQYRERTLTRVDDTTIEIDDVLHQDVDPSLSGDACSIAEAKQRGATMPCVAETISLADER
jgi:hypothetical protein